MIVTAWKNGNPRSSGSGYGLKVKLKDRDLYFKRQWKSVVLQLDRESPITVNIEKDSFWGDSCHELIKKEIGLWFLKNKKAPWPKGNPPKFLLEPIKDNHFSVKEK